MQSYQQTAVRPRSSIETISVWALIASIVVTIFIVTPFLSVPLGITKTFVLLAGALITLALYIFARLGRGNIIFPPFLLVGALWLPVIAYALSSVFSGVSFMNALWGSNIETDTLGFILAAASLGTLSALVLRRPEHYRSFFNIGAIVFGVIVVLQILFVIVGQFAPNTVSPSFSTLGSFQDLAFLLGLGIISILIALREVEISELKRRMLIAVGAGALFLLAVANISLVWILVAIVSLGLFVETIMQRGPKSSDTDLDDVSVLDEEVSGAEEDGSRPLVLPLIVLAISLFFYIGGTLGGALSNALHVNLLSVSPSWQSTFAVGNNVYKTSPVFGSGPGTFGADWLKYRDVSINNSIFWNVDFSSGIGFIPTSFVTTGFVGALAWTVFLIMFAIFGLRSLIMRAPQDLFIRSVSITSFVSAIYLFVSATFGLPNAIILALAFVFAGIFISTTRFSAPARQWGVIFSRSPRLGFVIVFSLTIILLGSVVAMYALVERYISAAELSSANAYFSAGNFDEAEKAAQSSLSFSQNTMAYQIEAGISMARLNQIVSSTTMPSSEAQQAFQTALSAGINAAITATTIAPSDYQNWLALGNLYAEAVPLNVSGAYDNAKTAYNKALELNPTNPQIHYVLAQLNIANKDTKTAEDNLKAAIGLKQDYTTAILLLSQLQVQDGNVKDALSSALAAAYFTPNDPNILFQVGILYAAQNDLANAVVALSASVTANPQFANARYFLSAVYAKQGNYKDALTQMQAIADMSDDNATAVATQLTALEAGNNPFPANLLSVSAAPVK